MGAALKCLHGPGHFSIHGRRGPCLSGTLAESSLVFVYHKPATAPYVMKISSEATHLDPLNLVAALSSLAAACYFVVVNFMFA